MASSSKRRKLSADGSFYVSDQSTLDPYRDPEFNNSNHRRSLFVRSLAPTVTTDRLAEYFSQSNPIKHAIVVVDHETKASKGYGFVTFADSTDAKAALSEFDHTILDGRKIKVELAESRHRETAESGGTIAPSSKAAELRAAREKRRAETAPPKLIVRNLPWSIKEPEDLALLFRRYGKVKHAIVPKQGPDVQAGFGFVVLRGRKNAERAMEGVNGKEVDGRTVAVDWAVEKSAWEELQRGVSDRERGINDTKLQNEVASAKEGRLPILDQDQEQEQEQDEDGKTGLSDSEGSSKSSGSISSKGSDVTNETFEFSQSSKTDGNGEIQGQESDEASTSTVFVRNLPYDTTDDALFTHFRPFGPIRYARVVYDSATGLAKGTGFVCFFNDSDAKSCVQDAPEPQAPTSTATSRDKKRSVSHSLLQDALRDPSGRYTLSSRILSVTRAVSKSHAAHLSSVATATAREKDRRHIYLLSEGTVPTSSPLHKHLSPAELNIRAASYKQRQRLIRNNPSLHMSLKRLSVRNIPRGLGSKELKALAREAVVEFAKEVKAGKRQPLSKEELNRGRIDAKGGDDDIGNAREEQKKQKAKDKGRGIVRQAKIVFEGREGGKVSEASGAGRSRGYGFVEFRGHREALMGLRWLNGHSVQGGGKAEGEGEGRKRLIVEFALENAQVVARRKDMERKSREGPPSSSRPGDAPIPSTGSKGKRAADVGNNARASANPRAIQGTTRANKSTYNKTKVTPDKKKEAGEDEARSRNEIAKRNRIIAKKRQMRKARAKAK